MARYRVKDETDLRWNRIRRRLTREFDTQIADWREERLNEILGQAWTKYAASLQSGEILELSDSAYVGWVAAALEQTITIRPADEAHAGVAA